MREKLNDGYILSVQSQKTQNDFIISSCIGEGASCLVYEADFIDDIGITRKVRIKELFPMEDCNQSRDNGKIIWDTEELKENYFESFTNLYKRHIFFQNINDLSNSSSLITDCLYDANDTKYIIMDCSYGETFDKSIPSSMQEVFKTALALTKLCARYHSKGYLMLDIKPQNFLTINETNELIKYLDYDSLVSETQLKLGKAKISFSEKWAAPELMKGDISKISKSSDYYSIGAIVYYKLFDSYVTARERSITFVPDFERCKYTGLLNPKTYHLLKSFFKKTLTNNSARRYQTDEEIIHDLEQLVRIADPDALFLKSSSIDQKIPFVGRKKELSLIDNSFACGKNIVFVNGCGGIGKTELAKYYAIKNAQNYNTVIFGKCIDGLENLFNDSNIFEILNCDSKDLNDKKRYDVIKQLVDYETLLIIDNLDVLQDESLNLLFELPCKILITTRANLSGIIDQSVSTEIISLGIMEYDDLENLFYSYYKKKINTFEKDYVPKIIQQIGGLSLMIPILAKQMMLEDVLPSEMYDQFNEHHLKGISTTLIKHFKDNQLINATAYNQASRIFDVFKLTDEEKRILFILALLGNATVGKRTLAMFAGLFKKENKKIRAYESVDEVIDRSSKNVQLKEINELIEKGYLVYVEKNQSVIAHNIIRELSLYEFDYTIENCTFFKELLIHVAKEILYTKREESNIYDNMDNYLGLKTDTEMNSVLLDSFDQIFYQIYSNLDLSKKENAKYIFDEIYFYPICSGKCLQDIQTKFKHGTVNPEYLKEHPLDMTVFNFLIVNNNFRRIIPNRGKLNLDKDPEPYLKEIDNYYVENPGVTRGFTKSIAAIVLGLTLEGTTFYEIASLDHILKLLNLFEKVGDELNEKIYYQNLELNDAEKDCAELWSDMDKEEIEDNIQNDKKRKQEYEKRRYEIHTGTDDTIEKDELDTEENTVFDPYKKYFFLLLDPDKSKYDKNISIKDQCNLHDIINNIIEIEYPNIFGDTKKTIDDIRIETNYPEREWNIFFEFMFKNNGYFNHDVYVEHYIYEYYARHDGYMFLSNALWFIKLFDEEVDLGSIFGIYNIKLHIDPIFLWYEKDPYYTLEIFRRICQNSLTVENVNYTRENGDYNSYKNGEGIINFLEDCIEYANEYNDKNLLELAYTKKRELSNFDIIYEDSEVKRNLCLSSEALWTDVEQLLNEICVCENEEDINSIKIKINSDRNLSEFYKKQLLSACNPHISMFDVIQLLLIDDIEKIPQFCSLDESYIKELLKKEADPSIGRLDYLFVIEELAFQYYFCGNETEGEKYADKIFAYVKNNKTYQNTFDYLIFNAVSMFALAMTYSKSMPMSLFGRIYDEIVNEWLIKEVDTFDYYMLMAIIVPFLLLQWVAEKVVEFKDQKLTESLKNILKENKDILQDKLQYLDKIFIPEDYLNSNSERFEEGTWTEERKCEYLEKCHKLIEEWEETDHTKEEYQAEYKKYFNAIFPLPDYWNEEDDSIDAFKYLKSFNKKWKSIFGTDDEEEN